MNHGFNFLLCDSCVHFITVLSKTPNCIIVVLFLQEKPFFWEILTTINHRINRYTDKDFTVGNFERVPNQVTYLYHKGITYRAPYGSNQVTYRDRYTETAPGG